MARFLDWVYCKKKGNPSKYCECDMYWDCVELSHGSGGKTSE